MFCRPVVISQLKGSGEAWSHPRGVLRGTYPGVWGTMQLDVGERVWCFGFFWVAKWWSYLGIQDILRIHSSPSPASPSTHLNRGRLVRLVDYCPVWTSPMEQPLPQHQPLGQSVQAVVVILILILSLNIQQIFIEPPLCTSQDSQGINQKDLVPMEIRLYVAGGDK